MDPDSGCGDSKDRGKHRAPPAQMEISAIWPAA
jgi:hypothetical protein